MDIHNPVSSCPAFRPSLSKLAFARDVSPGHGCPKGHPHMVVDYLKSFIMARDNFTSSVYKRCDRR
jgi:hypothetical protein